MRKIIICLLFLLFGVETMHAQVNIQINGNQSFVLNENNGIYFHNDSLIVDGVVFALDDIQVITFQSNSSIVDIESVNKLELAPNPANDFITLRGIGNEPQNVTLYSISGIKLMEQKAVDGTVINISHLPEGIYILRCGNRVAKMVKQL